MLQIQLCHHAAGGKYIGVENVVMRSQNALRCSVPPGGNVGGVRTALNSQILAGAEINNFGRERIFIDHDVVRLEVAMKNAEVLV